MAIKGTELTEQINQVLIVNDPELGLRMLERLNAVIAVTPKSQSEQLLALERVKARIMVVAMKHLLIETLEELFELSTWQIFSLPDTINVIENFKDHLRLQPYIDDRNKERDIIRKALERSVVLFGSDNIQLGAEQVRPSAQNWLKIYVSEIGTEQATSVQIARFFSQNREFQKLPKDLQRVVRNLIEFYEFLKLRSDTLQGYEDYIMRERADGQVVIIGDGQVEELYDPGTLREIREEALRGELSEESFNYFKERFPEQFEGIIVPSIWHPMPVETVSTNQLQNRIQRFFQQQKKQYSKPLPPQSVPQRDEVLAAELLRIARKGEAADTSRAKQLLQAAVSDKDKLAQFLNNNAIQKFISQEFPTELGDKNKKVLQESPPVSPLALQALLIALFQKQFGLSPEETAWHSYEIIQKIPFSLKDFKTLVTYDVRQNKLVWKY